MEGKSEQEIAEHQRLRKEEVNKEVLNLLGDIADKDEAPPENVLFICKLNPITEEEDLELIFSQFGKVIGCEIIKDYVTGDSLCFGFIEFQEKESCEKAFLKMDNVLIDDRRVHVDFSQSTSRHTLGNPNSKSKSRYGHLMKKHGEQHDSYAQSRDARKRTYPATNRNVGDRKRFRQNSPERRDRSPGRKPQPRNYERRHSPDRRRSPERRSRDRRSPERKRSPRRSPDRNYERRRSPERRYSRDRRSPGRRRSRERRYSPERRYRRDR